MPAGKSLLALEPGDLGGVNLDFDLTVGFDAPVIGILLKQGPILNRTQECLGATDIGIVKLRRMLTEQIEIVQAGGTPMGIVPAEQESALIELDVIRDRYGLSTPERQKAS
jgi:hypothetical protein